ncbi:MAG: OFA family MFS transporter [Candidatus Altiarchaeota archaeon]
MKYPKLAEKTRNRWIVVAGALLVQLCLGAIYSWSVFVKPLIDDYSYTATQTQAVFSVALASFAVTMIFAGRWQDKKGPRVVATAGGIVLCVGYLLAYFTGGSFTGLVLTVGVVGGAGIGLAYVCPIASCVKWFPDKRGMVSGLAVAGFGAGAWIFAKISATFIDSYGLMSTFLYLGLIFLASVVLGAQLLVNPPYGYKPAGWNPPEKNSKKNSEDFEWRDMLATRQFWMLWVMFVFGAAAGLMVIGILKPFGAQQMQEAGGLAEDVAKATAVSAVGVLALFNGAGRIVWGAASDRIGRTKAMGLMFLLQGAMMLYLTNMGTTKLSLAVAAAWVGFNFGGNFALFPSATADYFGTRNVGINYGLVFTSYGVAGIAGPLLGGRVFDATGSYTWAFIPAGIACIIAAALSFKLKHPHNG